MTGACVTMLIGSKISEGRRTYSITSRNVVRTYQMTVAGKIVKTTLTALTLILWLRFCSTLSIIS